MVYFIIGVLVLLAVISAIVFIVKKIKEHFLSLLIIFGGVAAGVAAYKYLYPLSQGGLLLGIVIAVFVALFVVYKVTGNLINTGPKLALWAVYLVPVIEIVTIYILFISKLKERGCYQAYKKGSKDVPKFSEYIYHQIIEVQGPWILKGLAVIGIIIACLMLIYSIVRIFLRITYEYRVNKFIDNYVVAIDGFIDETNEMTEKCLFSQSKVQGFVNERKTFKGRNPESYIKEVFKQYVLRYARVCFIDSTLDENMKIKDKIFFYYYFVNYNPYFKEQGIALTDILESYSIIKTDFLYIEDVAFFSREIYDEITDRFIPFIKKYPKLSEIRFDEEYLFRIMYNDGFLNEHIDSVDLKLLTEEPRTFKEYFMDLYSVIEEHELKNAVENGVINRIEEADRSDESGETLIISFELNHVNENGIIEGEYGMQFEQHRVEMEPDSDMMNQLDCMEGIPA